MSDRKFYQDAYNREFTLKEVPFDWNDNFSEIALEDFATIQKN